MARIAENTCHNTWPRIRRELNRIAIGTFTGPAGIFRQRTEIIRAQRDHLAQLKFDPPTQDLPAHPCEPLTSTKTPA